jgi:hypothetical protein
VIAHDTADGVVFTSASLDGRELDRDTPGGIEVDADDGRRLRVRWTFPPASVASRTFVLRYVVARAD